MNAAAWERAKSLLAEAADLPAEDRPRFVVERCPDPELRREVLDLLTSPAPLSEIITAGALAPGDDLGPYRIEQLLGRGGMGEVYRARDRKLNRDIAIKVLPRMVAADPESRARFEREAQTIAALNHPNIVTIYSVEEANEALFLTMEYIEGKPLSALIVKGGLPQTQIFTLAIPLTDAVAAAHQKGITHRDLKPANVMVSADGRVKVLDFGLAKLIEATPSDTDSTGFPTNTLTGEGRIVGTVAYMSPEQAEGKRVDHRSDIFSLGIMLYEMATGARPFTGETRLAVLFAIVNDTPRSVTDLNPGVPREFARLLKRCLAKEVVRRYQSAIDLRNELEELRAELGSGPSNEATARRESPIVTFAPPTLTPTRAGLARRTIVTLMGLVAVLLVGGIAWLMFARFLADRRGSSLAASTHRQITFVGDVSFPAISRDGRSLAYIAGSTSSPKQRLMVQDLSGGQPLPVFEGEHLGAPVWSNDGSALLIFSWKSGGVILVPRLGGLARKFRLSLNRTSWSPDDAHFAGINLAMKQISVVAKDTGTVTNIPLTGSFAFLLDVDWSPSGDRLLFETTDGQSRFAVWTIRNDASRQEKLVEDDTLISCPRWSSNGDVVYYLRGEVTKDLMRVPVSTGTGKVAGTPQAVLAGLQAGDWFTISGDGRELAYTRRLSHANLWLAPTKGLSSTGHDVQQLTSGTASDADPSISPDGRHIAFSRGDGNSANVFVMPFEGGDAQQMTFLNSKNFAPVWSPDGGTIAFGSTEGGQPRVWQVSATGGVPRVLGQTRLSTTRLSPLVWAPADHILYQMPGNQNWQVLNPKTGDQTTLVQDSSVGWMFSARSSPDGGRIAVFWNRYPAGLWLVPIGNPFRAVPLTRTADSAIGGFGGISQIVDATDLRNHDVKLVAHVKANVNGPENNGQCYLRVDRPKGQVGFFDNMQDRPVRTPVWKEVTIEGRVDTDAERLTFGCFLMGEGQVWIANVQMFWKDQQRHWEIVPIKNGSFEEADPAFSPTGWFASGPGKFGYVIQLSNATRYQGGRSVSIQSTKNVKNAKGAISGTFLPIGWSPDSLYLFASDLDRPSRIVMIRADGGEPEPLIDLPLRAGFAIQGLAITPDGQRIVYAAGQEESDVWITRNFDGTR